LAAGLVVVGFVVMAFVVKIDARAHARLLPHRAGDLTTICGAGYAAVFALTAASMGFMVYGPPILQQLRGLSPLWAGYVVGVQAMAWTISALLVAGATESSERRWIRLGGLFIPGGVALLAIVMRDSTLLCVIAAAAVTGSGFGLSSSLMNRRVLRALSDEDRAIGSSALMAVRLTGGAVGAAIAGTTANLAGMDAGLRDASASVAARWVFVAMLPLAVAGGWAMWRLA